MFFFAPIEYNAFMNSFPSPHIILLLHMFLRKIYALFQGFIEGVLQHSQSRHHEREDGETQK